MSKEFTSTISYKLVLGLNAIIGVFRLYFAYLGVTPAIKEFLTVPVSSITMNFISVTFLLLGVGNIVTIYGLFRQTDWRFKSLIIVSIVTILFDVWGYTVQTSAAIGFIVPLVSLLILYKARRLHL
jgi:hypothetical protein